MKLAIVTGAAGGVGLELSKILTTYDYEVIAIDCDDKPSDFASLPINYLKVDLCDGNYIQEIKETLNDKCIDLFVHCAAISSYSSATDYENLNRVLTVNLKPLLEISALIKGNAKIFPNTERSIISIGSYTADKAQPHVSAYAASKILIESYTRNLAMELASSSIRVNCIKPSWVDTPMMKKSIADLAGINSITEEKMKKILLSKSILKKAIDPSEIADMVLFLASSKARSITGQSIVIDNGLSAVIP